MTHIIKSYILILLSVYDTTILLQKHSMAELASAFFMAKPASAFSMAEPAYRSWWRKDTHHSLRPSVTELGSITEGRPGLAQHSRTPGFPPTGPAVGGAGSGPSQKADRVQPGTPHDCDEARCKRVVCVWRGRAAVAGAEVSRVSSVSCLLCSRGQRLLGTGNGEQHGPLGRKKI